VDGDQSGEGEKRLMPTYALGERKPEFRGDYWIAPNATVIGSVVLENNASVWWNAVVRADNDVITIGENSNVQDGAVLHTDPGVKLTLGRGVTIGHQCMIHGCTVGDDTLIGIKAIVMNHAVIGKNCIIGAGALVPEGKVIPDGSLVIGVPGKVARTLTLEDIARVKWNADAYVANLKRYRELLRSA
jgi:carbonic anhydrase/acetyltransferase-like protein (isoleucine patch superfamily)